MIGDGSRLVTPKDIQDVQFNGLGPLEFYRSDEVDDFLDRCALTVKILFEVNVQQSKEIASLRETIGDMR